MSMEMSFYTPVTNLVRMQNLVKRYDGRFKCNPLPIGERAKVDLSFEDAHNANRFSLLLHITEQKFF